MQNDKQIARTLQKLLRLEQELSEKLFIKATTMDMSAYSTPERLRQMPSKALFKPVKNGDSWEAAQKQFTWYSGTFTVPGELDGQTLFFRPNVHFYEAMLWVNGKPMGEYANKIIRGARGNHYCDMVKMNVKAGEIIEIALEAYMGQDHAGVMPLCPPDSNSYQVTVGDFEICIKNQGCYDFYFNLKIANDIVATTEATDFRRADLINALLGVNQHVYCDASSVSPEEYQNGIDAANAVLKEALSCKNAVAAPTAGVIGHSHMDTAWLWGIDETVNKCARTYANQLSLMEQYPEYLFIQSSAYHAEMMRRDYPAVFEGMRTRIAEGRYELCGSAWVECDCNLTSGESMVRQFLWGQKYTQKHFGFMSKVFWLPDTFGYSAAIPQIMKGCGVDYFLTSKLTWNDTTDFPYDSFYWQGIDGTKVMSHLNPIHLSPDPATLNRLVRGVQGHRGVMQKGVTDTRLISFGFGDGGGGPEFEMLETLRRCEDVDGCPKTEYTRVDDFMQRLEQNAICPNTYAGELYVEGHRGTLTTNSKIKRNNRKAEQAIHNAELMLVRKAVREHAVADDEPLRPHVETLLVNQFHDILPGTSIPEVNDRSFAEMGNLIEQTNKLAETAAGAVPAESTVTALNTLSFTRGDVIRLPYQEGKRIDAACRQQVSQNLDGQPVLAVADVELPAFGGQTFTYADGTLQGQSPFVYDSSRLSTPFADVSFDDRGRMSSFIDKANGRELVRGLPFNTFLMAEDVPLQWDNWDIDADIEAKYVDESRLLSRSVVSDGCVELRLRSEYALSEKSTVLQDMVFYADSPRVDFETKIDWHDKHRLLKAAFDTSVHAPAARQEIQFGYATRYTSRNNPYEQAMFETCNHKYSDLSEPAYGVAVLNDCKYGIGVYGGSMRLTLMKSGERPDTRADEGEHVFIYSLLPHCGGFSADAVIQPAYLLNQPPMIVSGAADLNGLIEIDAPNIIAETVKPCHESAERAFILRLYEAEGSFTSCRLKTGIDGSQIAQTNMLEEEITGYAPAPLDLQFRAFEIKTFKIIY